MDHLSISLHDRGRGLDGLSQGAKHGSDPWRLIPGCGGHAIQGDDPIADELDGPSAGLLRGEVREVLDVAEHLQKRILVKGQAAPRRASLENPEPIQPPPAQSPAPGRDDVGAPHGQLSGESEGIGRGHPTGRVPDLSEGGEGNVETVSRDRPEPACPRHVVVATSNAYQFPRAARRDRA